MFLRLRYQYYNYTNHQMKDSWNLDNLKIIIKLLNHCMRLKCCLINHWMTWSYRRMTSKHEFKQTYRTRQFNLIRYHLNQQLKLNHYSDHQYLKLLTYHVMMVLNIQLNLMIHQQRNMYNILTLKFTFLVSFTWLMNNQSIQHLMKLLCMKLISNIHWLWHICMSFLSWNLSFLT